MRRPVVIGNWKMYGTLGWARTLATQVREGVRGLDGIEVAICPPFTALAAVAEILGGGPVGLGAQTCHHEAEGAHTGEVSPQMLVDVGCQYVLVGHSERRREMGETDEQINRKVLAVLAARMVPVLCVGETGEERRQGLTFTTVEGQLRAGLAGVPGDGLPRVMLAYEPVWAIGTGLNATPAQAAEVHGYLRGLVSELSSREVAQALAILYGGSVKPDNAEALAGEPEIDGMLVGGASLQAEQFLTIIKRTVRAGATVEG